jgi:hypothetical protein
VLPDENLSKDQVRNVMAAAFHVAASHELDVKAAAVNSDNLGWAPPEPLSMSDYRRSVSTIFRDSKDNIREGRVNSALKDFFESYWKGRKESQHCTNLAMAARTIYADMSAYTILAVRDSICASPQVTLKLPSQRKLLVIVFPAGAEERSECVAFAKAHLLKKSFPHARVLSSATSKDIEEALFDDDVPSAGKLQVQGCGNEGTGQLQSVAEAPPSPSAASLLRLIVPHNHAVVGRLVSFQGDGARPGEILVPIVSVNNEFWPQNFIQANSDGTFNGTVVIGLPQDCDPRITFTLRIFSGVSDAVKVGIALHSWPAAASGSLPLELTRGKECNIAER